MDMFCFQCEQSAHQKGCTKRGVCSKEPSTANLQDELINNIICLANCDKVNDKNTELIIKSLFTTVTNVNFDDDSIQELINKVKNEIKECNFDINSLWREKDEDKRSLKSLILFGLKGMAAYAYHARILGYKNKEIDSFFYKALKEISQNKITKNFYHLCLK